MAAGTHRNTGAPFPREDGERWERGAIHTPTDAELQRRGYKLRPVSGGEAAPSGGEAPDGTGEGRSSLKAILETPVDDLPDALSRVEDVALLRRARRSDDRKTAAPIYTARIESLEEAS